MSHIHITLQSDLCAGNGQSLGNLVDTDCCMDLSGLPVIPARRLKGCLRQAGEFLQQVGLLSEEQIIALFGDGLDRAGSLHLRNAELSDAESIRSWITSNDVPPALRQACHPGQVSKLFTSVRGQTRLLDGVADKGSLRYTRVLNRSDPMTGKALSLTAPVELDDPGLSDVLDKCCKAVRHIGSKRNRGLGFVRLSYVPDDDGCKAEHHIGRTPCPDSRVRLCYRVALDANLLLNGITGTLSHVPGRSVIGCMASAYIRSMGGDRNGLERDAWLRTDEAFRSLFLTGECVWSPLHPVVADRRADPAPLMLTYLKNRKKYLNPFCMPLPTNEKTKSLDGAWAAELENGYAVSASATELVYHHRHANDHGQEAMLYSQASIPSQLLYEGYVEVPDALANLAGQLIRSARLRFGQSKTAQYSACCLTDMGPCAPTDHDLTHAQPGEAVYVVLQSDMLLRLDGRYVTDTDEARGILSQTLGLENKVPAGVQDYIQFSAIGGYNERWHMQKSQLPVLCGGSVLCFTAGKELSLPARYQFGELRQEGLGCIRLLSEADMKVLCTVHEASIDRKTINHNVPQAFRDAMLLHAAEAAVSKSAVRLFADSIVSDSALMRGLNNGRVRLMLEEAESLHDLTERVNSIKRDAPRLAGSQLLKVIYGDTDADSDRLKHLMCSEPELAELAIRSSDEIKKRIWNDNWKRLLFLVLHMHDYEAKRRAAGKGGDRT